MQDVAVSARHERMIRLFQGRIGQPGQSDIGEYFCEKGAALGALGEEIGILA